MRIKSSLWRLKLAVISSFLGVFALASTCAEEGNEDNTPKPPSGLDVKSRPKLPLQVRPRPVLPAEDVVPIDNGAVAEPTDEASLIEEIPDGPYDDSHYTLIPEGEVTVIEEAPQVIATEGNTKPLISPFLLPEIQKREFKHNYQSISSTKQFMVSGQDRERCALLSSLCESVKKEFLKLLTEEDKWKDMIVIRLVGKPGDKVEYPTMASRIELIGGKPFYTIYVKIGQGVDTEEIRSEILKSLIYERSLRNLKEEIFPDQLYLPAWLIEGVNETLQWKNNTLNRNLYATLFERGDIFTLNDLFKIKNPHGELDASTLGIYKATAGSLILCLLNQSGGKEAFKRMMDQSILSAVDGETLLKQNFPGLHVSKNSLYKWWALQLSQMSMRPMTESLTMLETDRLLTEYTQFSYLDPETKAISILSLDNYKSLLGLHPETRRQILQPMLGDLVRLRYRAFPTQTPIILDYIRLAEMIKKGELPDDIEGKLTLLQEKRAHFIKLGSRTRDYIDWFTIVTTTRTTGSFDNYVQTMSILREKKEPREDEISKYLDDIEKMIAPSSKGEIK